MLRLQSNCLKFKEVDQTPTDSQGKVRRGKGRAQRHPGVQLLHPCPGLTPLYPPPPPPVPPPTTGGQPPAWPDHMRYWLAVCHPHEVQLCCCFGGMAYGIWQVVAAWYMSPQASHPIHESNTPSTTSID